MRRLAPFLDAMEAQIAEHTAQLGARVAIDPQRALDRSDSTQLRRPSRISANGACRLLRTADGRWIALNLARAEDRSAAPALVMRAQEGELWPFVERECARQSAPDLRAQANLLGLALAEIGETPPLTTPCATTLAAERSSSAAPLAVVDLSNLWAGPLCGAIFAAMGAHVCKIESDERPDTTAISAPALDQRLNGAKARRRLAFRSPAGQAALRDTLASCDVLITSARARAFAALGLSREAVFQVNPRLVWIAITGHGWDNDRIAFGDDAAVAGGLAEWREGEPRFIGDALADPLTGLAAAAAALDMLAAGRGGFIDAALARVAAYAARMQRSAA